MYVGLTTVMSVETFDLSRKMKDRLQETNAEKQRTQVSTISTRSLYVVVVRLDFLCLLCIITAFSLTLHKYHIYTVGPDQCSDGSAPKNDKDGTQEAS